MSGGSMKTPCTLEQAVWLALAVVGVYLAWSLMLHCHAGHRHRQLMHRVRPAEDTPPGNERPLPVSRIGKPTWQERTSVQYEDSVAAQQEAMKQVGKLAV